MNTINYLSKLFGHNDFIYTTGPLKPEGGYSIPNLTQLAHLSSLENFSSKCFYSINPLSKYENKNVKADGSVGSVRASVNVVEFKNFLLESDSISVEVQKQLVPYLNQHIPIRLATFSGSKSIHMIISVADTLLSNGTQDPIMRYKQIWEGLCEKAESITVDFLAERSIVVPDKIFDRACKDPSRLSRIPAASRLVKEAIVVQEVVFEGGLIASEDLLALASEYKLKQYDSVATVDSSTDLTSFEKKLRTTSSLSFLRDRLEYPERWTSSANMYTELFKYTLWCVDATQVPFQVLDAYLTKRVYPSILAKGYPRNPRAGVLAAYEFKGLL